MKAFLRGLGHLSQPRPAKHSLMPATIITTSIHPAISSTRRHVATTARSARRNAVTAALAFQNITVARHRGTCRPMVALLTGIERMPQRLRASISWQNGGPRSDRIGREGNCSADISAAMQEIADIVWPTQADRLAPHRRRRACDPRRVAHGHRRMCVPAELTRDGYPTWLWARATPTPDRRDTKPRRYVAYYRVSTKQQGRSGLALKRSARRFGTSPNQFRARSSLNSPRSKAAPERIGPSSSKPYVSAGSTAPRSSSPSSIVWPVASH